MKKKAEIFSLLFCVSFSIICLSFNTNPVFGFTSSLQVLESKLINSFSYVETFFLNTYNKVGNYNQLEKEYFSCVSDLEKNKHLKKNIGILEEENHNLRRELNFTPKRIYTTIKAKVLSVRLNSVYPLIIVSKGRMHGIAAYMPVTARAKDNQGKAIESVVGKIIFASDNYSFVQPIINQNFSMGVKIDDDFWAILTGNSKNIFTVILSYIDDRTIIDTTNFYKNKEVIKKFSPDYLNSLSKVDKTVLTSGGAGVFPKNIPVGTITQEIDREGSFKKAYVKPYVNFQTLEYVNIIQKLPEKWSNLKQEQEYMPHKDPILK